jgi:mannose-6-phosphate isomerase-like protein (cupin superfamily)
MDTTPIDDGLRDDGSPPVGQSADAGSSDAGLHKAHWAVPSVDTAATGGAFTTLNVDLGPRNFRLIDSVATGHPLISNGFLGADIIRLGRGERFRPHVHVGDHLLLAIGGEGTVTLDGRIYPVSAGEIYMVPGGIPHAVGAVSDHVLLSVGAPHRSIFASDRMQLAAYDAIVSELGDLECLLCGVAAVRGDRLHDLGCQHCPCADCAEET